MFIKYVSRTRQAGARDQVTLSERIKNVENLAKIGEKGIEDRDPWAPRSWAVRKSSVAFRERVIVRVIRQRTTLLVGTIICRRILASISRRSYTAIVLSGELRHVRRGRIFLRVSSRIGQQCVADSRSRPIVVPQLLIELIADIWYWKKTMVMEMMMDEYIWKIISLSLRFRSAIR